MQRLLVRPLGALLLTTMVVSLLPQAALAYEDMATLDLAVGASVTSSAASGIGCCGPSVSVAGSIPVSRNVAARGFLALTLIPGSDILGAASLGLEVFYALDIVRFVPLLGAGLGLTGTLADQLGNDGVSLEGSAHLLLGLDYLLSRTLLVGIDLRPGWVFAAALDDGRLDPFWLTALARVTWRFDL